MADEWGILVFPEPPVLRPLGGGMWELASDYWVPMFGTPVRIPAGFRTDLASVPHFLWSLIGSTDLGGAAPIAHDYGYQLGGRVGGLALPRRQVDRLFRTLMQLERVLGWRRWTAWAAVRAAGWACWRRAPERAGALQSTAR